MMPPWCSERSHEPDPHRPRAPEEEGLRRPALAPQTRGLGILALLSFPCGWTWWLKTRGEAVVDVNEIAREAPPPPGGDDVGQRWAYPLGSGLAVVTSCYGLRALHGRDRHMHRGIDLKGQENTFVRAMASGRVRRVGHDPDGWGRFVELDHENGWVSLYAHLVAKEVMPGQRVKARQIIGYVGHTGNALGPHLHLETKLRGKHLDPLGALLCSDKAAEVRMRVKCRRPPRRCPPADRQ